MEEKSFGIPATEVLGKEKTEEDKLRDKIKEQEGTIQALQGMLGQMVPVVESILPLFKERPEIDKQLIAQIERMTQIANMMCSMGTNQEEIKQ